MSKKVIVISTSLRPNSNSDVLAKSFADGAKSKGHEVEYISLKGMNYTFCKGCMACHKLGRCAIRDDASDLLMKVCDAEVVCWASPIYYYEMSGQMKTLIDRLNALYTMDYRFRDVYFLSTAAEEGAEVPLKAEGGVQGWVDCFERAEFKGSVFCGGVEGPNEMAGRKEVLAAYELGANV